MLDISCEFLDTASTYTKYREYHFLNHQIPLFHAPAVQIWSMQKNSTKWKKLTKYTKKSQNCPKFEQGVLNNVRRPHKKMGQKNKKKSPGNVKLDPETALEGVLHNCDHSWYAWMRINKHKKLRILNNTIIMHKCLMR